MYNEFISFLKKYNIYDEEIINSFFNNAFIYEFETETIGFNMCVYAIDNDNHLVDIKACIPYISNYKTMLINIHEYVHYYMMYKKLGQKVIIGRNCELLPMLYEKIFIIEKNNEDLNKYDDYLNQIIKKEKNPDYLYALEYREKLINVLFKKKLLKNKFL